MSLMRISEFLAELRPGAVDPDPDRARGDLEHPAGLPRVHLEPVDQHQRLPFSGWDRGEGLAQAVCTRNVGSNSA